MLVSYIVETFTTELGNTAYVKYDLTTKDVFVRYDTTSDWTFVLNSGLGKSHAQSPNMQYLMDSLNIKSMV